MIRWLRRRPFLSGLVCGVLIVVVGGLIINRSTIPDRVISGLLQPDTTGKADAIVVMGAGVVGDCVPNQNAVRRVLLGVRLWRQQRAPFLFFTGASGEKSCPVAVAMARLAREIGVPESSIQTETTSLTTRQNGEHSAPLLRRLGVRRVLVVTDRLHMRRSTGTFAHLGFEIERASVPIYEGHPDNVSMLAAGSREFAALAYYTLRGWVSDDPALERAANHQSNRPAETVGSAGSVMEGKATDTVRPLVLLGASYAGGWDPETVAGSPVVVRGVSGQQSFEMLARFESDVVTARPRAVVIWGFINDVFRTAPAEIATASARIRENYATMINLARKNGIEPIIGTEVTMGPKGGWGEMFASWAGTLMGKESYQDRVNKHVMAINRSLIDLAGREGVLVLDLQSTLAGSGGGRRREFTKEDGSHITPAGYDALTAYARPILDKHLSSATTAASRP